jgi:hypothetical protein
MQRALLTKLRDRTGQGLVELALLLPVLVVLTLGLIDLSRAIHAHNCIVNMSREGANLASRSMLIHDRQGRQMIMNSLAGTAQALDMKSNGMMYLIRVRNDGGIRDLNSEPWKQRRDGPASAVDETTLPNYLGNISIGPRDEIWICEVFYQYRSMFARGYHPELHSVAIFAGGR